MINLLETVEQSPQPASASQPPPTAAGSAAGDVELGAVATVSSPQTPTPAAPRARRLRLPRRGARAPSPAAAPSAEEAAAAEVAEQRTRLFATADEVTAGIAEIRGALQRLRDTHAADMQESRVDKVKSLRERMVRDIRATSLTASKVKRLIEGLVAEARRAEAATGGGSAAERERSTVTYALEVRFRDVMRDFSALRATLAEDHAAVVARRYAAVAGHPPSADELATLAGDAPHDAAEAVFARALAAQGGGAAAAEAATAATLAEVHERHDAIVELERGLAALHQMFLDMATLVDQQGDIIDSIESQVAKSTEYVARGEAYVAQARRHQRAARAKKVLFVIALLALAAIIAVAIAVPAATIRGRR